MTTLYNWCGQYVSIWYSVDDHALYGTTGTVALNDNTSHSIEAEIGIINIKDKDGYDICDGADHVNKKTYLLYLSNPHRDAASFSNTKDSSYTDIYIMQNGKKRQATYEDFEENATIFPCVDPTGAVNESGSKSNDKADDDTDDTGDNTGDDDDYSGALSSMMKMFLILIIICVVFVGIMLLGAIVLIKKRSTLGSGKQGNQ